MKTTRWNFALISLTAALLTGFGDQGRAQDAPSITTGPANQIVAAGAAATFNVVASGNPPLSYQWFKDGGSVLAGGRISGATSDSLTIFGVEVGDVGYYVVTVSNTFGVATSSPAILRLVGMAVISVDGQTVLSGSVTRPNTTQVSLQTAFPNGSLFYTLDGSEPSFASAYCAGPFGNELSADSLIGCLITSVGAPKLLLLEAPQPQRGLHWDFLSATSPPQLFSDTREKPQ